MVGRTCLVLAMVVNEAACCFAAMQTTRTTYAYDADGAVTAVTEQVDSQSPSVVYLTWDNFVPNATDPTDGTVLAGNGNLLGIGPTPGTDFTTEFQYDQRNRLTSAAANGTATVAYTYHPASLMASSTLNDNDALRFYYDTNPIPEMTNIEQAATGISSAYLGDTTYLSDGTEQMRCQPRKDMAGIYDPAQQSFTPQRYDPYGAPASATSNGTDQSTYDLHQNPFQYDAEYRDPSWGGYYLRARWYLPDQQTFLSRDLGDAIHRYGYGGGNPVGNTDPTGLRYTYGDFSRAVNRFLRPLNQGARGELLPLIPVYGQIVGGVQLLGNLPRVWHHPNFQTWASFSFLVASAATEIGDASFAFDRASGPLKAFGGRIAADAVIGVGQTALIGVGPHGKTDVPALVQSISYNVSGILWGRLGAGFGYRSHPLSADDVERIFAAHLQTGTDDQALVFKVRQATPASISAGEAGSTMNSTLPALDLKRVGFYHEGLLAVSKNAVWYTEVGVSTHQSNLLVVNTWWNRTRDAQDISPVSFMERAQRDRDAGSDSQFQFAGTFRQRTVNNVIGDIIPPQNRQAFHFNPEAHGSSPIVYDKFSNNCQDYVAGILATLRSQ